MKNFNENLFKSCIKGKIKFSTSTFVKFLITGTIALSLTACGGGGGGGGSSSVVPPIIEKPDVKPDPEEKPEVNQNENSNGNLITVNQKFNNKGDITLTNNSIGIIGSNSDITNDGDISISNLNTLSNNNYPEIEFETSLAKNYYKILQEMGVKVGIISEKGNVINNGNINLTGNDSWGIVGIYSNILNKGNITSNNSTDSVGIMNLGRDTINDGKIILNSDDGIGIYVANKIGFKTGNDNEWIIVNGDGIAQVTNTGTIEVNGKKSQIGINAEGKNIDIINSEKGEININNNYLYSNNENGYEHYLSAGISSDYLADETMNDGDIKITNEGKINITSSINGDKNKFVAGSIGIHTEGDKTTIINSGDISSNVVLGENSKIKGAYSFGILAEGNETTINNSGNINIKVTDDSKDIANNKVLIAGIVNLSNSANNIINNNTINITGKKYNGTLENLDSNVFGGGIYSNIGNITNNGVLSISGDKMFGIYGGNNSIVKNENEIKLDGDYVVGIKGDNSQLINNKNISINSKNNFFATNVTLLPSITYETGKTIPELILGCTASIGIDGENSKIINNGNISLNGNNIVGIYGYDSEISTEKGSKITLTGGEATVIYGANNSSIINKGDIIANITNSSSTITTDGILIEGNGKAENYGNISMTGKLHIDKSSVTPDNFIGMDANGSSGEKAKVINNGIIKLKHEIDLINPYDNGNEPIYAFDAIGMEASNRASAINNKDIIGQGAITGMNAYKGANITNSGTIKLSSLFFDGKYNDGDITRKEIPSWVTGMNGNGEGTKVINESSGVINLTGEGIALRAANGAEGINNGTINLTSQIIKLEGDKQTEYTYLKGLEAREGGIVKNSESGKITINGSGDGIRIRQNSKGYNYGTIDISSKEYGRGIEIRDGYAENHGNIILKNGNGSGIRVKDYGTGINYKNINILSNGYAIGMEVRDNGYAENRGNINLKVKDGVGIKVNDFGTGTNYKDINILSNYYAVGMEAQYEGNVKNYGNITLKGKNGVGIKVSDFGKAENFGNIYVKDYGTGMLASDSSSVNNYGIITVIGKGSVGMEAFNNATAINEKDGTINAGTGALGMRATDNGVIINKGTINIAADANGGMFALNGGKIENYGKIIIDKKRNPYLAVIYADNDANIKNEGNIITDGDINIEVGGTYTIGTTIDKTFGKLTGNNINLDGNLVVTTAMAKGSYENSYKLDNMIEGENITLGDSYKNFSDSLLYDLEVSKDKDGNLDGELTRNENSIADFTSNSFSQVGETFDKYLAKENYEKLSKEDKELVDKIFTSTSSSNKVEETIEKVAGREYLNISRQIFDIKDSFRKYDSSVISTLGKYDCNFTLIGEYGDINSKDGVVGYDSKMTGFNGAFKLSDSLFGTIGYGYSDINYDKGAEGKIQTIHGGIYKDYAYNKSNIRLGIFGEYNFHETDRENLFGNVNTDFNSYLVGVTGEISKKYGDSLYIQPKFSLDIAYGNVESFDEDNSLEMKKQDYTSVLPKVEIILGKNLNNVELFAKSSYSYELGDLDKDMEISLLNENIKVKNDTMDKGNLNLSVGTEVNFDSLSLTAELGKEFGKRDREFVKAGFSYKF